MLAPQMCSRLLHLKCFSYAIGVFRPSFHSSVSPFILSFIYLFIHSLTHSLTYSLTHLFPPFIRSFVRSFIHYNQKEKLQNWTNDTGCSLSLFIGFRLFAEPFWGKGQRHNVRIQNCGDYFCWNLWVRFPHVLRTLSSS